VGGKAREDAVRGKVVRAEPLFKLIFASRHHLKM